MSTPDAPTVPKPPVFKSRITASLKVECGPYYIHVNETGMQLASVSPLHVKPGDFEMYQNLMAFAIKEWARAKEIEGEANKVS